MPGLLLDTHAWVWSLRASRRLSPTALQALARAEAVYVSPVSFFEIGQKVRVGKWPEMESIVRELPELLAAQGGFVAELGGPICLEAGLMDWDHRDPFDRLLAATALATGLPLLSADIVFDQLAGRPRWPSRLW